MMDGLVESAGGVGVVRFAGHRIKGQRVVGYPGVW